MVDAGNSRVVVLPQGSWTSDRGKTYRGGKAYRFDVPIERIPYFKKEK